MDAVCGSHSVLGGFGRRRTLLCLGLVLLLLVAMPVSAFAAGSVLFWTTNSAPSDTFIGHYGGEYNGKIYVMGGIPQSGINTPITDLYEYTPPPTDSWQKLSGQGLASGMASWQGGFAQYGNKIYIFGGRTSSAPPVDTIWTYDLITHTTAVVGQLKTPRTNCGVTLVGSNAYIVGGSNTTGQLSSMEWFDLSTLNQDYLQNISLPIAVTRPIVFTDPVSGDVYVFGGADSSNSPITQSLRFTPGLNPPVTAAWSTNQPQQMPYPRQGSRKKVASTGYVYMTGDASSGGVQEYDITQDQWGLIGSQPLSVKKSMCLVDATGSTLYDINGEDLLGNAVKINQVAQIVPATNVGTPVPVGTGTNVPVTATAGGAQVTAVFDQVTGIPGQLALSTLPKASVPTGAGIGFRLSGQVYDIATTATGWNTVTVRIPYAGSYGLSGSTAQPPKVWHWAIPAGTSGPATWVPITLAGQPLYDPANGTIVAGSVNAPLGTLTFTTTSLSPFGVEDPLSTANTPASSGWSLALIAVVVIGITIGYRRRLSRA
jgi:hypothetical protein